MKSLLTALCLFVTVSAFGANFPYIRLNNQTNRISDNGSAMTFNGVAVGSGGGGFVGAVSNSVVTSGLLAVGAGKTNGIAATAAHINSTLGFTPASSNTLVSTYAPIASPALTGTPTINGASIETQLTNRMLFPTQVALTHAGTVTLDFTPFRSEASLTLTGSVTFATSNLVSTNGYTIYGRNTQATNCALTIPAWRTMTAAFPATITALKEFTISLSSRGTVDTNVWAVYVEAP